MTAPAPARQGVIPNPVPGGKFTDTFGACRGGAGCPRKHAGVDIFAPRGSKVQAPIAGKVVQIGHAGLGGNAVWLQGDDGRAYYFAHLDTIAAKVGDLVTAGTQLGTVGNTGDAAGGATHLHFSINGHVGAENPIVNPFTVIDKGAGAGPTTPALGKDYAGRPIDTAPPTGSTTTEGTYGAADPVTGCLIKFPGVAGVGSACIFSRSQGRAVVGALVLAAGGITMAAGVALIAVYGFQSNAARLALQAAGAPGNALTSRRSSQAAAAAAQDEADTRAAERSARMAAAQNRQEGAERGRTRRRETPFAA